MIAYKMIGAGSLQLSSTPGDGHLVIPGSKVDVDSSTLTHRYGTSSIPYISTCFPTCPEIVAGHPGTRRELDKSCRER